MQAARRALTSLALVAAAGGGALRAAAADERYGRFTPDALYGTLAMAHVPAAHQRQAAPGEHVALSWGELLSDPVELALLTTAVNSDLRVPTKCLVSELHFRQEAAGWSDQQLEDEVASNAFLLPIDESKVAPGALRSVYAMGLVRY